MDLHVLAPLDPDHERAAAALAGAVAAAAHLAPEPAGARHISLVVVRVATPEPIVESVRRFADAAPRVVVRAHGYGFFCDREPEALSIHVPVVRGPSLDALHRELCVALREAGTPPVEWTDEQHWSPHITLTDRGLDARRLGDAVACLAGRHHPSWSIVLDRLVVAGPRDEGRLEPATCALQGRRG